jgi:hypothetical protein
MRAFLTDELNMLLFWVFLVVDELYALAAGMQAIVLLYDRDSQVSSMRERIDDLTATSVRSEKQMVLRKRQTMDLAAFPVHRFLCFPDAKSGH